MTGTTGLAIYAAICSTVGLGLSLFLAWRDRTTLHVNILDEFTETPSWGERDCKYIEVHVSNSGRRPVHLVKALLASVGIDGQIRDRRAAFIVQAGMAKKAWTAFTSGVSLPEGHVLFACFEFERDESELPLRVGLLDSRGRFHTKYQPSSWRRFWLGYLSGKYKGVIEKSFLK